MPCHLRTLPHWLHSTLTDAQWSMQDRASHSRCFRNNHCCAVQYELKHPAAGFPAALASCVCFSCSISTCLLQLQGAALPRSAQPCSAAHAMQLGCALPGQQLRAAQSLHSPCLRPAVTHSTRRAAAVAAASVPAAASRRVTSSVLQAAAASGPCRLAPLQQQQQRRGVRRVVAVGASSMSLPEPSGDSGSSSSSGQQGGSSPPAVGDAAKTMDPKVLPVTLQGFFVLKETDVMQ
jgi:hypothetical protein